MPRYMKRFPIFPAGGGGTNFPLAEKSIKLKRMGCGNRPFYHMVVMMKRRHQADHPIEQLGTFDPLPNEHNEKLVSLNIERIQYWMAQRTILGKSSAILLGLAGFYPMHPNVYLRAWKSRHFMLQKYGKKKQESEENS